MQTSGRL